MNTAFCDMLCCYAGCESAGRAFLNYSKYHRCCLLHMQEFIKLDEFKCSRCSTKFKVEPARFVCSKCGSRECISRNCGNESCLKPFDLDCPDSPQCINCRKMTQAVKAGYCPACTKFPTCKNCNIKSSPRNFNCGHEGCVRCCDENKCKNCISLQKSCSNCGISTINIFKKQCGHESCENCYENKCKMCFTSNPEINSLFMVIDREQQIEKLQVVNIHEGQYELNKEILQYPNCENAEFSRIMKCGNVGCAKCNDLFCNSCESNASRYAREMPLFKKCAFCKKQDRIDTPQGCGHHLCLTCITDNQICGECYTFCVNCKNEKKIAKFLECEHGVCKDCNKKYVLCNICEKKKCSTCDIETQDIAEKSCGHRFCLKCYPNEQGSCSECRDIFCRVCNSVNTIDTSYSLCSHFMCFNCLAQKKTCPDCCLQCVNCKTQSYQLITFSVCRHKICSSCIRSDDRCRECMQLKAGFNGNELDMLEKFQCNKSLEMLEIGNTTCIYCKKSNSKEIIGCGHKTCKKCKKNDSLICDFCVFRSGFCSNCGQRERNFCELMCKHLGCLRCGKNEYCFKCIHGKKKGGNNGNVMCIMCQKSSKINASLLCGHNCCHQCLGLEIKNLSYLCRYCIVNAKHITCLLCNKSLICNKVDNKAYLDCCNEEVCLYCYEVITRQIHKCKKAI